MLQPTNEAPLPSTHDDVEVELPGLWGGEGLDAVEELMGRLGVGTRLERSGHMVQEHLSTGGKRVRARLALAAFEAMGGTRPCGVGWAAACELVHNATLVHDDLQDGDRVRRGHPTTWVRHGAAQAINAGDLLLMLPFRAVEHLSADGETKWLLSRAIAHRAEATVRGQSLELDLLGGRRTDRETWLRATEGKTGALLALPVEGAAILAGVGPDAAARLAAPFLRLGVLFQVADDVIDLYGDKGRGERGSDLREGKVSALVVEHLRLHPHDAPWLLALLEAPRDRTPDADVLTAIERFRTGGALAAVLARVEELSQAALDTPILRAIPDLHAVARELASQIRSSLPQVRA